jgi:uncharacterized RDD family membrane protein YckC
VETRFRFIHVDGSERTIAGIPELIQHIRSGDVVASTMLFDSASQRWIHASQHDTYQTAIAVMPATDLTHNTSIDTSPHSAPPVQAAAASSIQHEQAQTGNGGESRLDRELGRLEQDYESAIARGIDPSFLKERYNAQVRQIRSEYDAEARGKDIAAGATPAANGQGSDKDEAVDERSNGNAANLDGGFISLRASTGKRFGTWLLDLMFIYALSFLIGIVLVLGGMEGMIDSMNEYLFGMLLMLVYYVPQEGLTGRTLGKRIFGTVAVASDGTRLSFGKALGRTLCRFIPFEAFSFLGDRGHPLGWHDKIPGTQVLVVKKLKEVGIHPY